MLYRHQFKLTSREGSGLRNMCMLVVSLYINAWFLSHAQNAPLQDIRFLKQLEAYETHNKDISRVRVKRFWAILVSE